MIKNFNKIDGYLIMIPIYRSQATYNVRNVWTEEGDNGHWVGNINFEFDQKSAFAVPKHLTLKLIKNSDTDGYILNIKSDEELKPFKDAYLKGSEIRDMHKFISKIQTYIQNI